MKAHDVLPQGIRFDAKTCKFQADSVASVVDVVPEITHPLSVILQVTRNCDFDCVFCSETTHIPDPSLDELRRMRDNLQGVSRVYISGGEPMLRADLFDILDLFYDRHIVGLPTNATVHGKITKALRERIAFANIGLDGPRSVTSKIRGDYDRIMDGIRRFQMEGIPLSLSSVVLSSTVDSVPFVCQIADVLGAHKLKLILPVPKGNALKLADGEYMTVEQARALFLQLDRLKELYGWRTKLTMTVWTPDVEGYSVLTYPNGETYAWPVYSQPDRVLRLGNLIDDNIETIWERNPFKLNHLRKYLGDTIMQS